MKMQPKVESVPPHVNQDEIDRRAQEEAESVTWSDPQDLPDELPPVMPYSSDLLPPSIGRAVDDIAERMQCPPDYPAASMLVAMAVSGMSVSAAELSGDARRLREQFES